MERAEQKKFDKFRRRQESKSGVIGASLDLESTGQTLRPVFRVFLNEEPDAGQRGRLRTHYQGVPIRYEVADQLNIG